MRAHEFLLEYDRQVTMRSFGQKIRMACEIDTTMPKDSLHDTPVDLVIDAMEEADPDPKTKKYVYWMALRYTKQDFKFKDIPAVGVILSEFDLLKPRAKSLGISSNINDYDYTGLIELIAKYNDTAIDFRGNGLGIDLNLEGIRKSNYLVWYKGPLGTLVTPLTEAASNELGRGTKWCTSATESENYFSGYNRDGRLYIWKDRNKKKFQFWYPRNPVEIGYWYFDNDDDDEYIAAAEFTSSNNVRIPEHGLSLFKSAHPVVGELLNFIDSEFLRINAGNSAALIQYAAQTYGRWPEAERILIEDPESAYYYARYALKEPWPKAEDIIADEIYYAIPYAKYVLKGPFEKAEDAILKDHADRIIDYIFNARKSRWPEAEPILIKNWPWELKSYFYAFVQERWPEVEPTMLEHWKMGDILEYAEKYRPGAWPELEKRLLMDGLSAHMLSYAFNVKQERWPEIEPLLLRNDRFLLAYANHFFPGVRWPRIEFTLLMGQGPEIEQYVHNHCKPGERWLDHEPSFLRDPVLGSLYASYVLQERWPEFEERYQDHPKIMELYRSKLERQGIL